MTRTIHVSEPKDFKGLIVRCRKCRTEVTLALATTRPAYECPGCRTPISLERALRAADALAVLQQCPPDGCDVEFVTMSAE